MIRGASKPLIILATGTFAVAGVGGYAWYESQRPAVLEIYVFDTPGLPSVFIRTPEDKRILIGGGANADIVRRLTDVLPFYSRRLDMIIAPDTDPRNITGLIEVLNRYGVGHVFVPAVTPASLALASSSDPVFGIFQETLGSRAVPISHVSAGQTLDLGRNVTVDILFPVDSLASTVKFQYTKASGPSLVFRVKYGTTEVLFTGNVTTKIQKFIATSSPARADVLVVSHSSTPSNFSRELLRSAHPDYLVYSEISSASSVSSKKSATKKKPQADSLAGVLGDHRFNIRGKGSVKITSDGRTIGVI